MGVDPVCAHSVVLRRVHYLPQRSTLPRCTSTIVHIPMWALRPPFLSAPIWSRWESSLSTWRKLVARSCLVRAEEILRLSHRIRHQLLSWSYSASTETEMPFFAQFPMSTDSLCKGDPWCSLSCQQDAQKTCSIGLPCPEMFSMILARSVVAEDLQLLAACDDLPQFHGSWWRARGT